VNSDKNMKKEMKNNYSPLDNKYTFHVCCTPYIYS